MSSIWKQYLISQLMISFRKMRYIYKVIENSSHSADPTYNLSSNSPMSNIRSISCDVRGREVLSHSSSTRPHSSLINTISVPDINGSELSVSLFRLLYCFLCLTKDHKIERENERKDDAALSCLGCALTE